MPFRDTFVPELLFAYPGVYTNILLELLFVYPGVYTNIRQLAARSTADIYKLRISWKFREVFITVFWRTPLIFGCFLGFLR